ncbi:hypothetical protein Daus18300_010475 [Diaporthe australafricana]|uniref:Fungal-type protein kinase domain-containing protein n=1 Tax=Diaporthe australafricana TaxID=127596 RepID=A0ABR3WA33_9PEZI
MATAKHHQATPTRPPDSPRFYTTQDERVSIRKVFKAELGVPYAKLISVNTTILYNALTTKRHADIDAEDDGSLRSEVLKNAIDLLQRFVRCAPLYLKLDSGSSTDQEEGARDNFYAKDVFCRTFCRDIEGFDFVHYPDAWHDVFQFFTAMKRLWDRSLAGGRKVPGQARVAAMFDARGDVAPKARPRSRKGALLWELMGLASEVEWRDGNKNFETWCVEAAVRIGSWRKKVKEDKDSLFRLPLEDDWGNHSDDLLPEHDDDAMKLFKELETKLRAFYVKCNKQMPEQRTALPAIAKKPSARTPTPEDISQEDGARDPTDPYETSTSDPREHIAPPVPGCAELERAKQLITDVVRANGREPDWDPELPRMVIRANSHRC